MNRKTAEKMVKTFTHELVFFAALCFMFSIMLGSSGGVQVDVGPSLSPYKMHTMKGDIVTTPTDVLDPESQPVAYIVWTQEGCEYCAMMLDALSQVSNVPVVVVWVNTSDEYIQDATLLYPVSVAITGASSMDLPSEAKGYPHTQLVVYSNGEWGIVFEFSGVPQMPEGASLVTELEAAARIQSDSGSEK